VWASLIDAVADAGIAACDSIVFVGAALPPTWRLGPSGLILRWEGVAVNRLDDAHRARRPGRSTG
jgi:hypothetical protein